MEIWKDIEAYKGLYQVSNLGNVKRLLKSKPEGKILTQINNGNDYMGVALCKDGKARRFYIHRIVAEAFIENPDNKEEVNHIDGNRQNNKLSNLEWVTRSENHYHRYKVLKQKGVNYGKTGKLNGKSKTVIQYKDNVELKRFESVLQAQRKTGINEATIRSNIYGKTKHAGGFVWEYA